MEAVTPVVTGGKPAPGLSRAMADTKRGLYSRRNGGSKPVGQPSGDDSAALCIGPCSGGEHGAIEGGPASHLLFSLGLS